MKGQARRTTKPLGTVHLSVFRAICWLLGRAGTAHLWLMYRKSLQVPLAPYSAKIPVDIGLADDADVDELAALVHERNPDRAPGRARVYRNRLLGGSLCFVARIDGAIVASNWIRVKTAIGADRNRMFFADDEIYTTDAYTARQWRGQGIHRAIHQTMLDYARQHGYRIAYSMARADNERSRIMLPRVGWQHVGTMLFFRPYWSRGRAFWQVWGDPYPMPLGRGADAITGQAADDHGPRAAAEPTAIRDAASFDLAQFDERELVADRPWAKTYRLRKKADGETAWLTIVPREHAGVLRAAVLLAAGFPTHVPQVIACDDLQHGWLLTRDHRGTTLGAQALPGDLLALIETYARLQAASVTNRQLLACLPAARVSQALSGLIDFLRPDRGQPDADERVGAAFFIGADQAQHFGGQLQHVAPLLERRLEHAPTLPDTINHGDLQPSHAARTADGSIVLYDWSFASRGPAGLSLHRLFGGVVPALQALQRQDDASAGQDPHRQWMARYVGTLSGAGYADEQTLRAGLPASIIAGAMIELQRFAVYATDEPDLDMLIRDRLLAGLSDLEALCSNLEDDRCRSALLPG